jgi:hypothetical protein
LHGAGPAPGLRQPGRGGPPLPLHSCCLHPTPTPPPHRHPPPKHPIHHLDPAWYAILGAALLCIVVAPMEVDEVVHAVEWDMLL